MKSTGGGAVSFLITNAVDQSCCFSVGFLRVTINRSYFLEACGSIILLPVQGQKNIPLKDGKNCELLIQLAGSEVTMKFDVTLVHRDKNRVGFRFIGEDTETMTHLRRLLELNIGSSEAIDKEISFWLKDI